MSIGQTLRDLLAPLGVYRWEGSFQWGELQSEGAALDQAEEALARIQREMHLATAREEGLTGLCHLLGCLAEGEPDQLRQTLAAVNDAVRGCGISALVEETEDPLKLTVSFPDTGGVPDDFARRQQVIEKLLPCHVLVEYQFQYMTWTLLEGRFLSWEQLEETGATWKTFEAQTL